MQRRLGRWFVAIVAVASIAPMLAAGRAIADGWTPIGDNAAIAIHTHDVFSSDTPLVGTRTTLGGPGFTERVRHPGPLEFWALALPDRAAGGAPWGIVVGTALIAIAALVAVAWAATRTAGTTVAVSAVALAAVGSWSLGRQWLVDPWNPYVAVLPTVAMLFLAWAVIAGDAWALPALALAASFVAQAHVMGVPLAFVMLAGATAVVVAGRPAGRQLVAAAVVLAVSWSFPAWDQLVNRPGNVVALARAYRAEEQDGVGWTYAARAVARAIGVIPLFGRPARDVGPLGASLPLGAWLAAFAVLAALVAATVLSLRWRDRIAVSAGVVALAALAVDAATTAQIPAGFPDVAFYRVLHLWSLGIIVWFALALMAVRMLTVPVPLRRIAAVLAAGVLVVAAPAAAFARSRVADDERLMEAVESLARAAEPELERLGPVRIDASGELYAQVLYGMVYELRRRGVDARVDRDDPYIGYDHAAPPGAPTLLVVGNDTGELPAAGARRVAEYRGWTQADVDELESLDRDLRALLDASGISEVRGRDPYLLYRDGTLLRLEIDGDLVMDAGEKARFRRYYDLRFAVDEMTFAAYLLPAG